MLDSLQDADNYADWIYDSAPRTSGTEVLEIGAGHGELTQRLVQGRFVTATDLSKRCVEELQLRYAGMANVDVRHADIAALGDDRRYDSVVLINVLEHIPDDLERAARPPCGLKPGGRLIVFYPPSTVCTATSTTRSAITVGTAGPSSSRSPTAPGFEYVDARYVNSVGAFAWWLFARRLRQTPTQGWSVKLYDRTVVPVLRALESRRTPRFGQSVFLVAANPDGE